MKREDFKNKNDWNMYVRGLNSDGTPIKVVDNTSDKPLPSFTSKLTEAKLIEMGTEAGLEFTEDMTRKEMYIALGGVIEEKGK